MCISKCVYAQVSMHVYETILRMYVHRRVRGCVLAYESALACKIIRIAFRNGACVRVRVCVCVCVCLCVLSLETVTCVKFCLQYAGFVHL